MSKKASSPPPAPDPIALANAQGNANLDAVKESARINSADIYGPSGSTTYQRNDEGIPIAQFTTLGPQEQAFYDSQRTIGNNLAGVAQQRSLAMPTTDFSLDGMPFDPRSYDTGALQGNFGSAYASAPYDPTQQDASRIGIYQKAGDLPYDPRNYGNISQYDDQVGNAVFQQAQNHLQPVYDQQSRQLEQRLTDRGLPINGEAYDKATGNLRRTQDEGWQNASDSAIAASSAAAQAKIQQEQGLRSTAFNEDLTGHTTANTDVNNQIALGQGLRTTALGQAATADQVQQQQYLQKLQTEQGLRNQDIQELNLSRNQNLNELAALLQGAPAVNTPSAPQMPNYSVAAPDVVGATLGSANIGMQGYQAQNANTNAKFGAAAGLGGSAMMANALSKTPYVFSSRSYKHDDGKPERILDRVKKIPVRTWRYLPHIDPRQEMHIGPYAEDWMRQLGLGDGKTISLIDAFGVTLQCIKELSDDLASLRKDIRRAA